MAEKQRRVTALRELQDTELEERLAAARQELWHTRLNAREGSLQQFHKIPAAKREIARILTVRTQRQQRARTSPAAPASPR